MRTRQAQHRPSVHATALPQEISLSLRVNLRNQRTGARLRAAGGHSARRAVLAGLHLDRHDRRLGLVDRPWRQKRPSRSTAAVRLTVGSAARRLKSLSCNTTLGSARTFAESRLSSRCSPRLDWLCRTPRAIRVARAWRRPTRS